MRNLNLGIAENLTMPLKAHRPALGSGDQLQLVSMGIGIRGAAGDSGGHEQHPEERNIDHPLGMVQV